MTGQFEEGDFGDWSEVWTVGGKLANPVAHFTVSAPCLQGGQASLFRSGPNWGMSCETAAGPQTFGTGSDAEPFRTLDGRVIPGRSRSNETAEQYHAEIIEHFITSGAKDVGAWCLGDEAGDLVMKMIGVNALAEDETRSVLSIVHSAFEKPDCIAQAAKDPSRTLLLLRHLADLTAQESLKQQIAETMAWVQAQ